MALPPTWSVLFISFNVDTPYKDGSASYWLVLFILFNVNTPYTDGFASYWLVLFALFNTNTLYKDGCTANMDGSIYLIQFYNI